MLFNILYYRKLYLFVNIELEGLYICVCMYVYIYIYVLHFQVGKSPKSPSDRSCMEKQMPNRIASSEAVPSGHLFLLLTAWHSLVAMLPDPQLCVKRGEIDGNHRNIIGNYEKTWEHPLHMEVCSCENHPTIAGRFSKPCLIPGGELWLMV